MRFSPQPRRVTIGAPAYTRCALCGGCRVCGSGLIPVRMFESSKVRKHSGSLAISSRVRARSRMHSISDLSRARALLPGAASEAFFSLYEVHEARASCVQPPALQAKYGAAESQSVVSVSSVSRRRRTFWNAQRSVKPQSFSATGSGELLDPTVTTGCDFCAWHTLTAQDSWGRVENAHGALLLLQPPPLPQRR